MTDNDMESRTLEECGIDAGLARDIRNAIRITGVRFTTFVSNSGERYHLVDPRDEHEDDLPEVA
jgi:hypothetical protein